MKVILILSLNSINDNIVPMNGAVPNKVLVLALPNPLKANTKSTILES